MTTDTDSIISFPDSKETEAQAALWIMRAEDNDMSPAQQQEFQTWLTSSDQHREAYTRLATLWGSLDILEELNDHAAAVGHQQSQIKNIKANGPTLWKRLIGLRSFISARAFTARAYSVRALSVKALSTRAYSISAFATIALIGILGLSYQIINNLNQLHQGSYTTALGEQQTINLPDGSTIQINTNSQIDVSYTDSARTIRLVQGEAFFDVAPNKQKPFSVYAGKGSVTAVGTAFRVFLNNEKIDVMVEEGSVALASHPSDSIYSESNSSGSTSGSSTSNSSAPNSSTPSGSNLTATNSIAQANNQPKAPLGIVTAGQKAIFDQTVESLEMVAPATMQRKLSWRQGRLAFAGEPLSLVVASVSRYTGVTIDIDDPGLRQLPIAGSFNVGEVDAMIEALEIMIDLRIERTGPKRVRISKPDNI
ncbi:fec operon regulator FecR [Gammaproteobacteria bacterium MOLA455]|nr:fec operon regulator FecR [Gammaproteobacteria bacterium MOLA455]